jgi:hypothetical protein
VKELLQEEKFNFIPKSSKDFITAFDEEIEKLGYSSNGVIGNGYIWGKYMILYSKTRIKTRKILARVYIRESSIVLRLYLNNIDSHRKFIEDAPPHIKKAFTGEYGRCKHCKNEKEGVCKFRKTYTIDGQLIEMCNGFTFEFWEPTIDKLPDYMVILSEFLPVRSQVKAIGE